MESLAAEKVLAEVFVCEKMLPKVFVGAFREEAEVSGEVFPLVVDFMRGKSHGGSKQEEAPGCVGRSVELQSVDCCLRGL